MEEKKAFGRGLKMLRLARGKSQESFAPAVSLSFTSVMERGAKAPSLDTVATLASLLDVHPLTLVTAMYVEKEGASAAELLSRVQAEFRELACQLPDKIGKDHRNRKKSIAEVRAWLESCLADS